MNRKSTTLLTLLLTYVMAFCVLTTTCAVNELKSPKNVIVLEKAESGDFQHYSWNKISLLALTDVEMTDSGVVKEAHSHHVNVILVADLAKEFKTCNITDKKCRNDWISDKVNVLYKTQMEGLLMKISPESLNSTSQDAVISLIQETSDRFEDADLDYVTAWLPSDTKRDFMQRIVEHTRWVALQIQQYQVSLHGYGSSLCKAISLFSMEQAMTDIYQLISQYNIPASKLMPVFPWKGIEYDCKEMVGSDCFIPCASRYQESVEEEAHIPADVIQELINTLGLIPSLDVDQDSFYIRMDVDNQNLQVYFDTYLTLPTKYELVESFGLGGLVVWSASDVTYTSGPYQLLFSHKMWSCLPSLK